MTFTVIVPAALLPTGTDPDPARGLLVPGLSRLLDGASEAAVPGGIAEALCSWLGVAAESDWPLAALAAAGEPLVFASGPPDAASSGSKPAPRQRPPGIATDVSKPPAPGYWMFATPIQASVGHHDVAVASPSLAIDIDQADRVLHDLDQFFAEDGLRFARGQSSKQWYVRSPRAERLHTRIPDPRPGEPLRSSLPSGEDAGRWRRYVSEIQMLLHAHPVNAARDAAGAPRIDGLWFWGGGTERREGGTERHSGETERHAGETSERDAEPRVASRRAWIDDPRLAAAVRGAGASVLTGGVAAALESSAATRGFGLRLSARAPDPAIDAPALLYAATLDDALAAADLDRWRHAMLDLDRTLFAPLHARAAHAGDLELILGGPAHAIRIAAGPRSWLGRFARRASRADLASLLARWRDPR